MECSSVCHILTGVLQLILLYLCTVESECDETFTAHIIIGEGNSSSEGFRLGQKFLTSIIVKNDEGNMYRATACTIFCAICQYPSAFAIVVALLAR